MKEVFQWIQTKNQKFVEPKTKFYQKFQSEFFFFEIYSFASEPIFAADRDPKKSGLPKISRNKHFQEFFFWWKKTLDYGFPGKRLDTGTNLEAPPFDEISVEIFAEIFASTEKCKNFSTQGKFWDEF